ncbi:MAG: hypothetical protein UT63_C0071G0002 [Candidatus Gottesmanbacteria bacterium GW2011_GWC2_39_8]|uniref:Uncharacterized protein n=1 Tax=Candidatus Gottesmanbacteria bacterium GW2011_GWC2_39_8 TaxID=1618450 RepID=A0A0G0T0L8_9BACT|nr:MAG: hypothetical protein UT63_C0071G0002 [Candidatus Gottesmanbacteria bacterium GW2011_GWC2_39_8]
MSEKTCHLTGYSCLDLDRGTPTCRLCIAKDTLKGLLLREVGLDPHQATLHSPNKGTVHIINRHTDIRRATFSRGTLTKFPSQIVRR